jgi:predicted nucleic-acid-binding protein
MIGLDANVLLRLFLEDDPSQTERAREFVATAARDAPLFVNSIVLVELVWVLLRSAKIGKTRVVGIIEAVLTSDDLEVMHLDCARSALESYRGGKADFADYYLSSLNGEMGCASTATFDAAALASSSFTPIP